MASTIMIVFRGLLVFNKAQAGGHDVFELGILDEPHQHVPRIMTFRNGVLEEMFPLRQLMNDPPVLWELVIEHPVRLGVNTRQYGSDPIDRMKTDTPDDDFRWMIDLENYEFPYGDINSEFGIDRSELKHVIRISSGEFYTRLKSPRLQRSLNGGVAVDFGAVAGVTGCDIAVTSGGAKLIGDNPQKPIFTFSSDTNVMYEISNSPPDTAPRQDHFPHYYEIFRRQPKDKFGFPRDVPTGTGANPPAPNPMLCGKAFLSKFEGSLIS